MLYWMNLLLFLVVSLAHAQQLPYEPQVVNTPGPDPVGFGVLMTTIVNFVAGSAIFICTSLFLIGAIWMVAGAGKEDQRSKGKDIMIDSLKGLAIILGSYGILRSVLFLVSGS